MFDFGEKGIVSSELEFLLYLIFSVDVLESFLKQFPKFPNAFLVGGPVDNFVIELADQVQIQE